MRWVLPDGTRDKASGEMVHDDDLMTAAMCTLLDRMEWYTRLPTVWTTPRDRWRRWMEILGEESREERERAGKQETKNKKECKT